MQKKFFVYMDSPTSLAVSKAIGKKGSVVKIENLSQLHFACRNIAADALFIGEKEWAVFGCTAMHPCIAPAIAFPIIAVSARLDNSWGKRQMIFRFVSIPEKQKNCEKLPGRSAVMRPFLQPLSLFFCGIGIKVLHPDEPVGEAAKSGEREKQVELARSLCPHKKCREIFDLISKSGDEGASVNSIQLQAWPDSLKNRRSDIQSYVCKIRKNMREHPECNCTIVYKDDKYFFVQEN